MCLKTVAFSLREEKGQLVGYGYKAVDVNGNTVSGTDQGGVWKKDRWMKAKRTLIDGNDGKRYTTGFHIFLTEAHAKEYGSTIAKVKFRNISGYGIQKTNYCQRPCIIADEMKFVEIVGNT